MLDVIQCTIISPASSTRKNAIIWRPNDCVFCLCDGFKWLLYWIQANIEQVLNLFEFLQNHTSWTILYRLQLCIFEKHD